MHIHKRSYATSKNSSDTSMPISTTGVPMAWAVLFSLCYFSAFPDNVHVGIAGISPWCNQRWHASCKCCYPCLMLKLISDRLRAVQFHCCLASVVLKTLLTFTLLHVILLTCDFYSACEKIHSMFGFFFYFSAHVCVHGFNLLWVEPWVPDRSTRG